MFSHVLFPFRFFLQTFISISYSCQIGKVTDTFHCTEKPCDASFSDVNFLATIGDCTDTLDSGAKCLPTCQVGTAELNSKAYHGEGERSCKKGKLTDTFKCVGDPCLLCWGVGSKSDSDDDVPATCVNEPHTKWNMDDEKQCGPVELSGTSCQMGCKVGYQGVGKFECDASVLADSFSCEEQTCGIPEDFGQDIKGYFSLGKCDAGGIMSHDSLW